MQGKLYRTFTLPNLIWSYPYLQKVIFFNIAVLTFQQQLIRELFRGEQLTGQYTKLFFKGNGEVAQVAIT